MIDAVEEQVNPALSTMRSGRVLQAETCTTTYVLEKLIVEQSITLLSGKGGIGKTWVVLGFADAINRGVPYLGLNTKQMSVYYIDFENPYPMLCDRTRRIDIQDVLFWHNSYNPPPPKIDSTEFEQYKTIPPGLIIFDTLRSSQSGDENNSKDMACVMGKLKELRDIGFTVLCLHHTPKSNERKYKGSTAIIDLCDQCLGLYRVKNGSINEIIEDDDDDGNTDKVFRLGTMDKTRFEPYHMYIRLDPKLGFVPAGSPETDDLENLEAILAGQGQINQTTFFEKAKEELGMKSKSKFVNLLRRGEAKYWTVSRGKNGVFYESK